ncbi:MULTISPECIES: hypothetical protein [Paenibacillus]|uniref:Uncharacterized protein n=1 Tax=Paenibacillus vandeheii TaxID=3035917 RepID=A0ABT8JFT0_9BACL|nr:MULTISPECIES: hypothetical protein [Paenibacillus]KGP77808.1 hypothetical protein P364_0131620 [Paenibacillus sp. MAEPY2]KGP77927.1 hypothetical protein P363_0132815 [Paenibacillus sp. MAEPY1]MDN4603956.1 hypothetical protein [Paenibacillus vandeheii]
MKIGDNVEVNGISRSKTSYLSCRGSVVDVSIGCSYPVHVRFFDHSIDAFEMKDVDFVFNIPKRSMNPMRMKILQCIEKEGTMFLTPNNLSILSGAKLSVVQSAIRKFEEYDLTRSIAEGLLELTDKGASYLKQHTKT